MATTPTDVKNLAELYDLEPLAWDRIVTGLEAGFPQAPGDGGPDRHSSWVATINVDGSPHVTGVGSIWHDGTFWFETGEATVKGRNIARDPRCSLSLATKGFDLVVEGVAEMVADPAKVAELAAIWAAGGWACRPDETGSALTADFSAPSAGPPPWRVYRIDVHRATALETVEPGGATRWTF